MRLFFTIPLFLFSVGYVFGNMNVNSYIDTVLNTALQIEVRSLGFDPLSLPDFLTKFEDHVKLFGKVHGSVKYTEGVLHGLSHASRIGDCSGLHYEYGFPFINCSIELDKLSITFEGKLKYGKLPSTTIHAKANMTSIILEMGISNYPLDITHLRSFAFLKIGEVQTKFTGLGSPLNKYLDILRIGFLEHVWPAFFNSVGKNFQYATLRAIERIPFVWY
ncbi:uncharacterized protein NPIL_292391 [Nephila pilipes]|uniref:Secreted protein n=1 Tax=Nephila pilipes TaxID=299642 RepID=A0A8X6TPG8_NEPPI|nr:uncharacterized protein NPIL_292391 [Nephila pilipes]